MTNGTRFVETMYIGPWQEYKLARLIQSQQNQIQALQAQAGIAPSPGHLRLKSDRVRTVGHSSAQSDRYDDGASESTATSSFSTKSAPVLGAQGVPRSGAQRQLEEYYQGDERERRREDREIKARLRPPRPNSGIRIGGKLPSERRDETQKKRAENLAKQRNSRINGMRQLYGLGSNSRPNSPSPLKVEGASSDSIASPSHSQATVSPAHSQASHVHSQGSNSVLNAASGIAGYTAIAPPLYGDHSQGSSGSAASSSGVARSTVQKPLWLSQHQTSATQMSTSSRSTAASSASSATPMFATRAAKPSREPQPNNATRLSPTLEEAFEKIQTSIDFDDDLQDSPIGKKCDDIDPLAMSSMSNASNDLISWSKNLRPEDLSPEATLASFFKL